MSVSTLCKIRRCPHYVKREMNNNRECELTGRLPGNMTTCPDDEPGKDGVA